VLLAALILSAVTAHAQPAQRLPKLDASLSASVRAGQSDTKQVIIRATSGGIPAVTKALSANGEALRVFSTINALLAKVPVAALEGLSRNPFVESISSDAVVVATQTSTTDSTLRGTLGLPVQSPTGSGVGVAIIDSGIEASSEFGSRISAFYDFTKSGNSASPSDEYGHGTHVAGLIAGNGDLSAQHYRGVAPKARLIGLKVLDQNGAGYTSNVIDAITYATKHKSRLGIDVINLSLGHPILESSATDPLVQAVEAASRANIVVVASAGNFGVEPATGEVGYAGITSPGDAPSAITVGAVDISGTASRSDDGVAPYSSRGPTWYDGQAKPDVVAPGHTLTAVSSDAC